jgi:hypothetical protein
LSEDASSSEFELRIFGNTQKEGVKLGSRLPAGMLEQSFKIRTTEKKTSQFLSILIGKMKKRQGFRNASLAGGPFFIGCMEELT